MFDEHYYHEQNVIESICTPSGHINSESHRPSVGFVVSKELHLHIKASAKTLKRTGKKSVMRVKQRPGILTDMHRLLQPQMEKMLFIIIESKNKLENREHEIGYSKALVDNKIIIKSL